MNTTIYLPDNAKNQLERSEGWWKPMPYKEQPEAGFTCKVYFTEEEMQDSPVEGKTFYPDRTGCLDDWIERMELVKVPKVTVPRKKVTVKPGDEIKMYFHCAGLTSNEKMKIVKVGKKHIYLDNGDNEEWKFDMATGRCLNDNTAFGASRTIDKLL